MYKAFNTFVDDVRPLPAQTRTSERLDTVQQDGRSVDCHAAGTDPLLRGLIALSGL